MSKNIHRSRVIYFGMINTTNYADNVGENLYVAAGSLKMLSVMRAVRLVGTPACIVTLPVLGARSALKYKEAVISGKDGVPVLFLKTFRNRIIRKIVGSFWFSWASLFLLRRSDSVIIYNHALEYIPALFILSARGISLYHDIEDLPCKNDFTLNGIINSIGFYFANIFARRKILVSRRLAAKLSLKNYFVMQGVSNVSCNFSYEKWKSLHSTEFAPLMVHYGGTLISDTGIDLFCKTVEYLASIHTIDNRPIHFYVTGSGQLSKISELQDYIKHNQGIRVFKFENLPYNDYVDLLKSCHVSLSLKKPYTQISETTFPSKAIEITSYGLALIATQVSDIPTIFDQTTAYLLPDFSHHSLGLAIMRCCLCTEEAEKIAVSGHKYIKENFSPASVGRELCNYLNLLT